MVPRRSSETLRIHVTIETNEPRRQQVEARLEKVLNVTTVETGRGGKNLLTEPSDEESSNRSRP